MDFEIKMTNQVYVSILKANVRQGSSKGEIFKTYKAIFWNLFSKTTNFSQLSVTIQFFSYIIMNQCKYRDKC